jgi:dTMP kinase
MADTTEDRLGTGLFLCIEGGDGSGKSTQYELLTDRIKNEGHPLFQVQFPRYGQPSAELVELYLHNEFGDATTLDPRLASLPYAIDRLAASSGIREALASGATVLAGRFTASNMAHQGAKFSDRAERIAFFTWLENLEHTIMEIPRPDYHFVLHLPARIALERVSNRDDGTAAGKKIDGHETSLDYQERAEQTYLDLVATFPDRFGLIECMDGDRARTPAEIHEEIWAKVKGMFHE